MGRFAACSHPCDSAWLLFVGGTSTASFALRGSAWTPGAGAFASGGCAASWRNRPLKTIVETNTTDMMVFSFRRTCLGDVFSVFGARARGCRSHSHLCTGGGVCRADSFPSAPACREFVGAQNFSAEARLADTRRKQ